MCTILHGPSQNPSQHVQSESTGWNTTGLNGGISHDESWFPIRDCDYLSRSEYKPKNGPKEWGMSYCAVAEKKKLEALIRARDIWKEVEGKRKDAKRV